MIKDYCGIFGIYNHKDAAQLTYLGLYALQHRGQESAGIVVSDGKQFKYHKKMGLVTDVFKQEDLENLEGHLAIGHVRYSTAGSSSLKNAQPFVVEHFADPLAIAHNGNLVNTVELRSKLEKSGSIFQSTMDTEVIVHLIAKSKKEKWEDKLCDALRAIKGAYSLVLLTRDTLIAARDPFGFKPLCLGKKDDAYVVASETCALDLIEAEYVRDIEPGEILFINENGLKSLKPFKKEKHAFCIFEYIYFSRPDSYIFGKNVHVTRKNLGRALAREAKIKADLVIPVPDSGICAGLGYAEESGIPLDIAIVRNHYVGRTFIQPSQFIRDVGVKIKLNPVKEVIKGKKIIIVEDSVVRGTTSRVRVKTLREAGAKEIHMCVSCPPHKFPCFYGIDFPTKKELIANNYSMEEIAKFIGLDSIHYLSLEGMLKSMPLPKEEFCTACFNGKYCIKVKDEISKLALEE
ncbi:MAG: amidophosphoribosyltransferase [Elusimicrobia bacterium]|nr:amidophosphoribosyltransferase [Elusimicrobiota bacterium]